MYDMNTVHENQIRHSTYVISREEECMHSIIAYFVHEFIWHSNLSNCCDYRSTYSLMSKYYLVLRVYQNFLSKVNKNEGIRE